MEKLTRHELLDQVVLALNVYADIELYESRNGALPGFCARSFEAWRQWRINQGLEPKKE